MPKLTDTQLVILSAAAKRKDSVALPPPKSLKVEGGALTRCLKSLLKKGLVEERPAKRTAASWREAEDGGRLSLMITRAGLQAIGVEPGEAGSNSRSKDKAHKTDPRRDRTKKSSGKARRSKTKPAPQTARKGTKQALLIDLLSRRKGATIAEASQAAGWQAHSVRGAISGTLKKKLGLDVTSETAEGRGRVYRIVQRR